MINIKDTTIRCNAWLGDMADIYGEMLTMDGYDDCIAGICTRFGQEPIIIYDRAKVITRLMNDGMTEDEAEEFHEFNQVGAWVGERTPAFLLSPNDNKPSEGSETLKQESASSVTRTKLRYSALIARLRYLVKTMRTNATSRKSGESFAYPELQSERNASAHSMEFWAQRIEEELMAEIAEMNEREQSAFKYNEA